ncbi:MAG: hypothetical protein ACRYFS_25285 [Janthinobacterium lividum]
MNIDEIADGENIAPTTEDSLEKLKATVFSQAINANSVALGVLGWIIGMTVTEPRIEELFTTADGLVQVRHSGEVSAQPLCTLSEFLGQVAQLCLELSLTAEQADHIVGMVHRRLQ